MEPFEGIPPPRFISVGGKPVRTVLREQSGNTRSWTYEFLPETNEVSQQSPQSENDQQPTEK